MGRFNQSICLNYNSSPKIGTRSISLDKLISSNTFFSLSLGSFSDIGFEIDITFSPININV